MTTPQGPYGAGTGRPQEPHQGQGPAGHQNPGAGAPGNWAPAPAKPSMPLPKLLALVIAGLGVLNMIMGFLPAAAMSRDESISSYGTGSAFAVWPILLLIGGLLALAAVAPKAQDSPFAVFVVSLGAALGVLFTQIAVDTDTKVGVVMLVVLGLLQAGVAGVRWAMSAGMIDSARRVAGQGAPTWPNQAGYAPQQQYAPQPPAATGSAQGYRGQDAPQPAPSATQGGPYGSTGHPHEGERPEGQPPRY